MCQQHKDLHNSVNQYFPNNQCMITKPCMNKNLFNVRGKLKDFNVVIKSLLIWFQISHCQQPLRNYHL